MKSPKEFFKSQEDGTATHAVTDGVSNERFDEAIDEAKAEGNLSRANVVRKVPGQDPKPIGRPELLR